MWHFIDFPTMPNVLCRCQQPCGIIQAPGCLYLLGLPVQALVFEGVDKRADVPDALWFSVPSLTRDRLSAFYVAI